MQAVHGIVELHNGIQIAWLQFAESAQEAVRVVTAQHVHVARCWATPNRDDPEYPGEEKNTVMASELITPETHPEHHTVGQFFRGWTGDVYFCDSYDPRKGFWMTSVDHPEDRRNVSERAIGRTYHHRYQCPHCKRWLRYFHRVEDPCFHAGPER